MEIIWVILGILIVGFTVLSLMQGGVDSSKKLEIKNELNNCLNLDDDTDSSRRDCLIKLDTILNKAFGFKGVKGKTLGERLKNSKSLFKNEDYNNLWEAHKLRNKIVHENYEPSTKEFNFARNVFKLSILRLVK